MSDEKADMPVGVSRRALLRGVAGSAAVSMLVQLPTGRADGFTASEPTSPGDVLWLFGVEKAYQGYAAYVIGPDGSTITSLRNLPHAISRTGDGARVVAAHGASGTATTVDIYTAATGVLAKSSAGKVAWPAEPDLHVSAAGDLLAVVGTCLVSGPVKGRSPKKLPDGRTRMSVSHSYTAHRAIEIFDAKTGKVLASSGLAQVPLGTVIDICFGGRTLHVFEHGPAGSEVHSYVPELNRIASNKLGIHAKPLVVDGDGTGWFLAGPDLRFLDGAGSVGTIPLNRETYQRITAKPFAAQILRTSSNRVVVVDASRRYAASVDTASRKLIREKLLSTSAGISATAERSVPAEAADPQRGRIYIPDRSGVAGGVWVHDAVTLEVLDRWHSDVAFRLAWVARHSGTVLLQSVDGPVAVHDPAGRLLSFVAAPVATARAL